MEGEWETKDGGGRRRRGVEQEERETQKVKTSKLAREVLREKMQTSKWPEAPQANFWLFAARVNSETRN